MWSPGASLYSPEFSTEPPEDNVITETVKSGVVRPLVASAGMIGNVTCITNSKSTENATLRLDISHPSLECMNLNRFTLPCPSS